MEWIWIWRGISNEWIWNINISNLFIKSPCLENKRIWYKILKSISWSRDEREFKVNELEWIWNELDEEWIWNSTFLSGFKIHHELWWVWIWVKDLKSKSAQVHPSKGNKFFWVFWDPGPSMLPSINFRVFATALNHLDMLFEFSVIFSVNCVMLFIFLHTVCNLWNWNSYHPAKPPGTGRGKEACSWPYMISV